MEERDAKGRFKIGHRGQKPIGAKSELKSDIRKKVSDFIEGKWDNVPQWFDALKPKDKLLFVVELLPYLIPRLKQVESTTTTVMEMRAATAALFPQALKDLGKDEPLNFSQN